MASVGGVEISFLSLLLDLRKKKTLHGPYSGDQLGVLTCQTFITESFAKLVNY